MAISKLSCPDCGTILRPTKPVSPGKKVKCPSCDLIFMAGEDDDEDDRPRKAQARKESKAAPKQGKKAAPAVKEKPKKEEEVYAYIKDPDMEDEDKKPKVEYAPDMSIRDLRGPAIVILTPPANWIQLCGMAGTFGWIILFVLLLIPTAFPITQDEREKEKQKQAQINNQNTGEKAASVSKGPKFFEVYGLDLSSYFLILMVPMILMAIYSAMVVAGGIKMQNLESRGFGITGCIMGMLPFHILGLQVVTFIVMQWGLMLIMDDQDFVTYVASGFVGLEWLASLGICGWGLMTLMNEEVIEGFEYQPE